MSKGLKQMVSEALAQPIVTNAPEPVHVSGEAVRALATHLRAWSGWSDARLVLGKPNGSPWAHCAPDSRSFTVNTDALVRNPNKVLLTVTPFRLRQEAVLTGAMLHEAGHARHSRWMSTTKPATHSDGTFADKQVVSLAVLMEEARVEGLMARDSKHIGAAGLDWTMRASAAALVPMTAVSADPNQQVMDFITSWALRAGRQYALEGWLPDYRLPNWVASFTALLHTKVLTHLTEREAAGALNCAPVLDTKSIISGLLRMTTIADDTGPEMVDCAREVLTRLFPETPGETADDQPMAGAGCQSEPDDAEGTEGQSDEAGEQAEGNTEPEDEGEGTDPGAGDAGSDETDEPSESESESESDQSDEQAESGATDSTEQPEQSEAQQALAAMESEADDQAGEQAEADAEAAEEDAQAKGAGADAASGAGGGWRLPTKDERDIMRGAERFLRDLIDVSESSKVSLTDTPSSIVDAGAMAAWKAGGQHRSPHFFVRTQRSTQPSPPVRIAILVDISSSMDELQAPSALLSWALSAAALDLRNFAGRGTQVESTLIHWGTGAYVIAKNGAILPGIKEHECDEGTNNMHGAFDLVEEQMPGFFDVSPTPVNRLLVQFTDWELYDRGRATPSVIRALESGVNMLSVVPGDYRDLRGAAAQWSGSALPRIMAQYAKSRTQRGRSSVIRYNPKNPGSVWATASEVLS